MPPPRYKIKLTAAERIDLERLTKTDQTSARKFAIARALLLCDASEAGPGWKVADVAHALGITTRIINIALTVQRFVPLRERGLVLFETLLELNVTEAKKAADLLNDRPSTKAS